MKKLLVLTTTLIATLFSISAFAQTPEKANGAEITFTTKTHDFGEIKQNAPASFEFEFTNTGNAPLIINDVQKPCSCQNATYPKEPILPGQSGKIKTEYSANKVGNFSKMYTVFTTANEEIVRLILKGEVVE